MHENKRHTYYLEKLCYAKEFAWMVIIKISKMTPYKSEN